MDKSAAWEKWENHKYREVKRRLSEWGWWARRQDRIGAVNDDGWPTVNIIGKHYVSRAPGEPPPPIVDETGPEQIDGMVIRLAQFDIESAAAVIARYRYTWPDCDAQERRSKRAQKANAILRSKNPSWAWMGQNRYQNRLVWARRWFYEQLALLDSRA